MFTTPRVAADRYGPCSTQVEALLDRVRLLNVADVRRLQEAHWGGPDATAFDDERDAALAGAGISVCVSSQ